MADTKQLTTMLKQLGWGSGFRLPIANDENRKLEQMLELKQQRLVSLSLKVQEVTLAVDNCKSNTKHLNSKIKHATDVEAAKRSQVEKEKQYLSLAERDHAKTEFDVRNMEKRLKGIRERNRNLEENVMRRKDSLGELVDVISFDKKAIVAYEEKFTKEDVYMKLIEDFADTDNEKLKKCRDEYQQLGEKVANSKLQLDQTVSDSDIMEGELEELAKRFRKAHSERNQFIENWKKTLEVLEDRDEEIMDLSNEYHIVALDLKKKLGMLERQEAFYSNITVQSKCYENELNQLERSMSIQHRRKGEAEYQINENSDAVSELANYITLTDKELKKLQTKLKDMHTDTDEWKDKIIRLKEEVESLRAKYDVVSMEHLTSAEQANQLQEFLEKEEKKAEALTKELAKQTEWKSQREKQTKEVSQQVILSESEARNLKNAIIRTRKHCTEKSDMLFKTNAVAYRLDLKVMNLTLKVRGLENPQTLYSKEDFVQTQREINHLKENCDEQSRAQTQVRAQIGHCEHVIFSCQRELQKEDEQNQDFKFKLHKLLTEIKGIRRDDELSLDNIKELGVGNSLLQVQLHRMVQSVKIYESKMLNLEQERITIEMAVKERKKDIEIYTSLMLSKKRALQDDSQKLKIKCHEVSHDVEARKSKYEMVMGQMWKGVGDSDRVDNETPVEGSRTRSEAYYIIKLSQEREHYRQEGDKWDERVKEAEKIVEGLQNTLALMMGTNEAFKDSLKPATDGTDEGRGLKELKQGELDAARNLKCLKDERDKLYPKLRQMQCKLDELVSFRGDFEHQLMEKRYELQGFIIEINGQKEKIQRATQQANKLVRELSKLETLDAELLQNDLRLRVTKEKYEYAVLTLEKMLQANSRVIPDTIEFLHEKGMEGLAGRITRKLISPSATSTPHQSGRSTPFNSRTSMVPARMDKAGSVRTSGGRSIGDTGQSSQLVGRRSTRKSVVFNDLTSNPSTKRMLDNISQGLGANNRSKSAVATGPVAPRQTVASTAKAAGSRGISFGELRRALQDAVSEQQEALEDVPQLTQEQEGDSTKERTVSKSGQKRKESNESGESAVVVELVDNRAKFEEATKDDLK